MDNVHCLGFASSFETFFNLSIGTDISQCCTPQHATYQVWQKSNPIP